MFPELLFPEGVAAILQPTHISLCLLHPLALKVLAAGAHMRAGQVSGITLSCFLMNSQDLEGKVSLAKESEPRDIMGLAPAGGKVCSGAHNFRITCILITGFHLMYCSVKPFNALAIFKECPSVAGGPLHFLQVCVALMISPNPRCQLSHNGLLNQQDL